MTTITPLLPQDAAAAAAMRQATAAHKGHILGPEARPMFEAMLGATPAAAGVEAEAATLGGIPGFRLRPENARPGARPKLISRIILPQFHR